MRKKKKVKNRDMYFIPIARYIKILTVYFFFLKSDHSLTLSKL